MSIRFYDFYLKYFSPEKYLLFDKYVPFYKIVVFMQYLYSQGLANQYLDCVIKRVGFCFVYATKIC